MTKDQIVVYCCMQAAIGVEAVEGSPCRSIRALLNFGIGHALLFQERVDFGLSYLFDADALILRSILARRDQGMVLGVGAPARQSQDGQQRYARHGLHQRAKLFEILFLSVRVDRSGDVSGRSNSLGTIGPSTSSGDDGPGDAASAATAPPSKSAGDLNEKGILARP
jgi:hypothetical protein